MAKHSKDRGVPEGKPHPGYLGEKTGNQATHGHSSVRQETFLDLQTIEPARSISTRVNPTNVTQPISDRCLQGSAIGSGGTGYPLQWYKGEHPSSPSMLIQSPRPRLSERRP